MEEDLATVMRAERQEISIRTEISETWETSDSPLKHVIYRAMPVPSESGSSKGAGQLLSAALKGPEGLRHIHADK